jgi:phosphoglycolate phosphatase
LSEKHTGIRGILFDKDGTLIEFNSIWIPLAFELTDKLLVSGSVPDPLRQAHRQTLLRKIGIDENGGMAPGSVYASGTEQELSEVLYRSAGELELTLPDYNSFFDSIHRDVTDYMEAHRHSIYPVPKAAQTLAALRELGLILGISTSDSEENTRLCLEETELLPYFHYIGCPSASLNPKPAGDILLDFSSQFGLLPEEVAVVGDTAVDVAFAKRNHAGLAIAVTNGAGGHDELARKADYILPGISGLLSGGQPIWAGRNSGLITAR